MGYRYITLDGTTYRADRIAWKMVYNDPVPDEIEHIDGNKSNDALANLRPKAGTKWRMTDDGTECDPPAVWRTS